MEFWGVEVKSGEPLKVQPPAGMVLHLSQVSLGESKKGGESVPLFLTVDEKKLVLATLFSEKLPQQQLDLVFDSELELSHNWKSGSVYFYGYMARLAPGDGSEFDITDSSDSSDDELEVPANPSGNGKPEIKAKEEKQADAKKANSEDSGAGKQKVKIVEPPTPKSEEEDESSDEDLSVSDDEDGDEDMDESDSGDDASDDSDEEETPKKAVVTGKKRAAESVVKTPGQDKKAKLTTPQKTDGKKAPHVATPYPSKQAGKTPGNKNQQTPKSAGGSHSCKSCNKTFNSENALDSHNKAKHSAAKSGKQ